jgi:hypothetical protein
MRDDITGIAIPFADDSPDVEKRKDTDMYLIAAYIAYGARLLRDEVEEVAYGRKLLVVEGDKFILEQAEHDWYAPDKIIRDLPANILKRYKTAIQDVKALIHSQEV